RPRLLLLPWRPRLPRLYHPLRLLRRPPRPTLFPYTTLFRSSPSKAYVFSQGMTGLQPAGFSHSEIHGSMLTCSSPWLIAAYHVLHRLLVPRHPPYALSNLTLIVLRASRETSTSRANCTCKTSSHTRRTQASLSVITFIVYGNIHHVKEQHLPSREASCAPRQPRSTEDRWS